MFLWVLCHSRPLNVTMENVWFIASDSQSSLKYWPVLNITRTFLKYFFSRINDVQNDSQYYAAHLFQLIWTCTITWSYWSFFTPHRMSPLKQQLVQKKWLSEFFVWKEFFLKIWSSLCGSSLDADQYWYHNNKNRSLKWIKIISQSFQTNCVIVCQFQGKHS